jgi:hypothetical protein
MTADLFTLQGLDSAVAALEGDLLKPGGPSISTMRNHNFAILLYLPREEYRLRQRVRQMVHRLEGEGWAVLSLALHELVFERVTAKLGAEGLQKLIDMEKQLFQMSPERALKYLQEKLAADIDGPDGLAKEVADRIAAFRAAHPDAENRTLVLLGRAGALYPFFRSSALLKQLGDRTLNTPVVLLYPGEQNDGLSFMQQLVPDRDYRPRIYA